MSIPLPVREVTEELGVGPLCTRCLATRRGLTRTSVEDAVVLLRRAFIVDTITPCVSCGGRRTVSLHGWRRNPWDHPEESS